MNSNNPKIIHFITNNASCQIIGDDSFIFTSEVETPLSEAEEEKTESKNNLEFNDEVKEDDISISNETVDLSKIDYNFIPTAKITTTKKRAGRNQAQSIPINDYLSVVDAVPPKRSRLNKSLAEACLEPSSEDFITSG